MKKRVSNKNLWIILFILIFLIIISIVIANFYETVPLTNKVINTVTNNAIKDLPNVETEVICQNSIMAGFYNKYPYFNLSLISYKITNNEDFAIKLKFESEILNYTLRSIDEEIIEPHSTKVINQNPLLKNIEFKDTADSNIHYIISSENKNLYEKTMPLQIYSKDTIIWDMDEKGKIIDESALIAAWVTPNINEIENLIKLSENNSNNIISGYQCNKCKTNEEWQEYTNKKVEVIFNILKNNYNITPLDMPIGFGTKNLERVKFPKDSIKEGSANSIEYSLLLASALESIKINSYIALIQGHAFICWDVSDKKNIYDCIETTMIKSSSFLESESYGLKENNENKNNLKLISIKKAREIGINPLS